MLITLLTLTPLLIALSVAELYWRHRAKQLAIQGLVVTEDNFSELLLLSIQEAVDMAKGYSEIQSGQGIHPDVVRKRLQHEYIPQGSIHTPKYDEVVPYVHDSQVYFTDFWALYQV